MNSHYDVCQMVRCATCGGHAERLYLGESKLTRTECSACDSLIVTCSLTGKVIENYMTHACTQFTRSSQDSSPKNHELGSLNFSCKNKSKYISLTDAISQIPTETIKPVNPWLFPSVINLSAGCTLKSPSAISGNQIVKVLKISFLG
jgi:hypothetical protein